MNPTPPPVEQQPNPPVEDQTNPSPGARPRKQYEQDYERENKYQPPPGSGGTTRPDTPATDLSGPGDARVDE